MKIQTFFLYPYQIPLINEQIRFGIFIHLTDEKGLSSWGEVSPLPKWSKETTKESLEQLQQKQEEILQIDWTISSYLQEIKQLQLFPSVEFGLESALSSLLTPLLKHKALASALLMGSLKEILSQAELRYKEGFTSAKLKVCNLNYLQAKEAILALKDIFFLRIDVNRAWNTQDSLQFFSQFSQNAFDYVEEPFQNPKDLTLFSHPLGVDESFPTDLSLRQLESLPMLKALIFKPTIQGGLLSCMKLRDWAWKRNINLVLSSSFESDIGLAYIASMAHRLSLKAPIGIGTYSYLKQKVCAHPLEFSNSFVFVPDQIALRKQRF